MTRMWEDMRGQLYLVTVVDEVYATSISQWCLQARRGAKFAHVSREKERGIRTGACAAEVYGCQVAKQ